MSAVDSDPRPLGAYGLRLDGLDGASRWLTPVDRSAPRGCVEAVIDPTVDRRPSELSEGFADLRLLDGGRLEVRRDPPTARFRFGQAPLPPAADVLHPLLAPAAALLQQWAGREALHAGALLAGGGGAVLLVGEREAGKSTTLALCARRDVGVIADDLAIVSGGHVFAGPRLLDLRHQALLTDGPVTPSRSGERRRVDLPIVPSATPLVGVVALRWGPEARLDPIAPSERLPVLLAQRMFTDRVAADLTALLDVVALPMLALQRPRGLDGLHAAVDVLLGYFA